MTNHCCFAFVIAFLITGNLSAQNPGKAIEVTGGIGTVVNNHPDFPEVSDPAYNLCVTWSKHFNGFQPWHRNYNFPRVGLSLNTGSLGEKDILGNYVGLMAEMSFEKRIGEKWYWAPRLSLGTAYFNTPYNEQTNPENVVIGSAVTFLAAADIMVARKLNDNFDILAKFGIQHASNSHFKLPNVGMNLPLFSLGVRYKWLAGKSEKNEIDTTFLERSRKIRFHARVALGVNESGSSTIPVNGPKYPVYLASAFVSKMYSPVNKVTAGVEGWYSQGVYDFIVSQEFYDDDRHKQACSVALFLGHEFLMGHFGLLTTAGIYIYNPFYKERLKRNEIDGLKDKLKSYIPARIGVQYYLKNTNYCEKNNLFVGVYIKTNFGQADFLESGIGYMF